MEKYRKRFMIFGLIFMILIGGIYLFSRSILNEFHESGTETSNIDESNNDESEESKDNNTNNKDEENKDTYLDMIKNSDRINILCLGITNTPPPADTIIVASIDTKNKLLDLISIPRDTYVYREGYETTGQKKINASYVGKNTAAKAQSSMNAVRDILQIPIHHFVKVEYEGVEKIIDSIDGVEVNIPFDMDYDDPTDNLHIHLSKGKQTLNGEDSVRYLRFRKNNDNTHASEGDIGRISRQQEFIKSALNKCLGLELIGVVNTAKDYIKTSLTAEQMIYYANKFRKIDKEDINTYVLPGEPKWLENSSFVVADKEKVKEMIIEIYKKK